MKKQLKMNVNGNGPNYTCVQKADYSNTKQKITAITRSHNKTKFDF